MKLQKLAITVLALATLLSVGSCRKYLDINDSPNSATAADPGLLFNYAAVSLSATRASGDLYVSVALAAQTIASGGNFGWGAANVYDISIYSLGNSWKTYYSSAGNNFKQAIDIAEASVPRNNNASAIARIMMAECLYETTMLWGDVPASEAWNIDIPYPKFDPQQQVLYQVISMLDTAIARIDLTANAPTLTTYDLFYNGVLNNWLRVANGMKLRALFALVDKDPSAAAQIGTLVTGSNMLTEASQNLQFPFYTTSETENPKFRLLKRYANGSNLFFFANNSVLQPMLAQNGPRIPRYFDLPEGVQAYQGVNSEEEADDSTATISAYLYRANAPELIFSYHEQLFFMAEAYARGLGVAQDLTQANTLYQQALNQASVYYGVSASAASTFASSKTLSSTAATAVDEIHLQQWIDLMDRPIEAFTQWRRSGTSGNEIPRLSVPPGAPNGPLIRRFVYPLAEELAPNPNAPKVIPFYYTPLWFDI